MNEQKKNQVIWHISSNRWNSAIAEYALSCAISLKQAGYQCFFTPLKGSAAEQRAKENHLDVLALSNFNVFNVVNLQKIFRLVKPGCIFMYGGPETTLTLTLPRSRTTNLIRFRGQDLQNKSWGEYLRFQLSHVGVRTVISPSNRLSEALQNFYHKDVKTILLGCNTKNFFYKQVELSNRRPELVVLGRFDPVKGHARLMKIMSFVFKRWPSLEVRPILHVIGEAANLSEHDIYQLAIKEQLSKNDFKVTAKRVEFISELLSSAVLGIIPSIGSEVICRVAEEFLLCGTPIVVSGVGSLEEVLFSEGAGVSYLNKSDEEAAAIIIKQTLKYLKEEPERKQHRAQQAYKLYSYETMAQNLQKILWA